MVQTSLANALGQLGRWNEALPILEIAKAAFDSLLKRLPDDPELGDHANQNRELLARAKEEAGKRR